MTFVSTVLAKQGSYDMNGHESKKYWGGIQMGYAAVAEVNNAEEMGRAERYQTQGASRVASFLGKQEEDRQIVALLARVSDVFISIGMPANIKGYKYLREAVKICVQAPAVINSITKELYPSIAGAFDTSSSKVERAIRHAIEVCWARGRAKVINEIFNVKAFDENDRPTNGEFIAFVADKLLLEMS